MKHLSTKRLRMKIRNAILMLVFLWSGGIYAYGNDYSLDEMTMQETTITVTGTIVDAETGEGLPGVSVYIGGSSSGLLATGTITDVDGNYRLDIPSGSTLIFSYIGYLTQEIKVGSETVINISLAPDITALEEVVVVGYGTAKKKDLTGSVTSMNSTQLTEMKKTDVAQAIQGRMAGVDVRRLSTKPGAPISIKVRGNTVINNTNVGGDGLSGNLEDDLSQPLYVVDGVFLEDINFLNPSDIEKMDILKDASATAIYGSRGANGVVIITTKGGTPGRTQVTYSGSVGVNSVVNAPEMMDGDTYVAFVEDALRSGQWGGFVANNGTASAGDYNAFIIDETQEFLGQNEQSNVANRNYTDWADLFRKQGVQTSHTIGISGGQDDIVYSTSIGYLKDEGVIGIEDFERYNLSASVTKDVNSVLRVGTKLYFAYSNREEGSPELFRSSFRLAPTVNPYNEDGTIKLIPDEQDGRFLNPLYEAEQGAWSVNTRKTDFIGNIFVELKPANWLSLKSNFAPNVIYRRSGEHRGLLSKSARNDQSRTRAYFDTDLFTSYTWDNIINLDFDISEMHQLKATLISSLYSRQDEGNDIETRNLTSNSFGFYNTGGGDDNRQYDSYFSKETLASFAARLNYSLANKYLFTFTGRYDGSSKLADGHKWAFFPSAAVAWRVSDEDFMQGVSSVSNLKLRVSYGEAGNDNPVRRYASQAFLDQSSYIFDDQSSIAYAKNNLSNDQLGWETSKEVNVGLELGLLENRISVTADYYNKKTVDALFNVPLQVLTAIDESTINLGSVRNKGVELVLNTINVKTQNFIWKTSINYTKNINEILSMLDGLDTIPLEKHNVLMIGQPIDAMFGWESQGIWQLNEADEAALYGDVPGQYKFVDQNGDDNNKGPEDKVILGSNAPDWIGGITNTFIYKNFDASILVYTRQGVFAHSEFHANFAPYQNDDAKFNKLNESYWTPNTPDAENPMPVVGTPIEDYYYRDMSFVKVGNIGFGYNFPQPLLDRLSLSSVRLSLDIQNPFIFSDYTGPDPETGLQNSYGMAYSVKTFLFGLNVKF